MRVLLDTNVILDSMLQRQVWHLEADTILQAARQGQIICAATPLSLVTVFYVERQTDNIFLGLWAIGGRDSPGPQSFGLLR